jgi:glycosyltransferase involved in cell wall biosynthesis
MIEISEQVPITAVIPVHNGEKFIEHSFKAVQQNLSKYDEAIFIVNGTTDSTMKRLLVLSNSDSRIRIIELENAGLVNALNIGIQESTSKWIARFDIDDFYRSDRLSLQRKLISSRTVAIFSDYQIVGSAEEDLGVIPSGVSQAATTISLFGKNRTPHPVALFSKDAFLESGRYKEEDFPAEDLAIWLRMTRSGEFCSVPLPLLRYRLHGNSVSLNQQKNSKRMAQNLLRSICIEEITLKKAIDSTQQILEEYQGLPYADERKLMFLLNTWQAISHFRYSLKEQTRMKAIVLKQVLDPNYSQAFLSLKSDLKKRRNYRKKIWAEKRGDINAE